MGRRRPAAPAAGTTRAASAVRSARPRPAAFQWRGRTYQVARIVDRWRYVGRWWIDEGEWLFIKVETTDGGLFELYFDTAAGEWRLYRIYD